MVDWKPTVYASVELTDSLPCMPAYTCASLPVTTKYCYGYSYYNKRNVNEKGFAHYGKKNKVS